MTDNAFSLGRETRRWLDLWLSRNAYIAGNVGIGKTPSYRLDVINNIVLTSPSHISNYGAVWFNGGSSNMVVCTSVSADGAQPEYRIKRDTGTYAVDWEIYIPVNSTELRWYMGGDKMRLDTAGNLTIAGGFTGRNLTIDRDISAGENLIYARFPTATYGRVAYFLAPSNTDWETVRIDANQGCCLYLYKAGGVRCVIEVNNPANIEDIRKVGGDSWLRLAPDVAVSGNLTIAGYGQINGAYLLMQGSRNTQRGLEWYYGDNDRYGVCQDVYGNLRLFISDYYTSGKFTFCRATGATTFTDLIRIDYTGDINQLAGSFADLKSLRISGTEVISSGRILYNVTPRLSSIQNTAGQTVLEFG